MLMDIGAGSVFISGGHSSGDKVINRYFDADGSVDEFAWERLAGEFHGSGCTLASAIAVFLAKELPIKLALRMAQAYTHDALQKAQMIGKGQKIPQRVGVMV
jgi:hydroxymethylpyrimidine/phosphomethylpyrimidine kinase